MNKKLSNTIKEDYFIREDDLITVPEVQRISIMLIGLYEANECADFNMIFGLLPHCLKEMVEDFIKGYKKDRVAKHIEALYDFDGVEKLDTETPAFRLYRTLYFDFDSDYYDIMAWHLLRTSLNQNLDKCEKILKLVRKERPRVIRKYNELKGGYHKFLKDTAKKSKELSEKKCAEKC